MARIKRIVRLVNKGDHAIAYVQLEDGDEEYRVYIGGQVEAMHHRGVNKAFVKRAPPKKENKP